MNCDFCCSVITVEYPGVCIVCPKGHEHKFHVDSCLSQAVVKGCWRSGGETKETTDSQDAYGNG